MLKLHNPKETGTALRAVLERRAIEDVCWQGHRRYLADFLHQRMGIDVPELAEGEAECQR